MITIKNVSKSYTQGFFLKKIQVLYDLSLQIEEGEIFGYLGHNGAGKTTTIKILLNLIKPDSGISLINNIPTKDNKARSIIGFLPDHPYFYDYLTAYEFLDFCGKLHNIRSRNRVEGLLGLVGLKKFSSRQLRKYSRGMLQRLGFAQALINDPKILILDEPMSGLDPQGRFEMRELLLHLKKQRKTIFFSSHILSDAEMICDRVGILRHGHLISIGKLSNLIDQYIISILIESSFPTSEQAKQFTLNVNNSFYQDEKVFITLEKESDIDPIIHNIQNAGGHIISVIPKRQTLEDIFIKKTKENAVEYNYT